MANSLQFLFQAIAQAQDERELRQSVMAQVGEYFTATRWRLSFLDEFPAIAANTPDTIKLALSLDHNPILRYLVERHAPCFSSRAEMVAKLAAASGTVAIAP